MNDFLVFFEQNKISYVILDRNENILRLLCDTADKEKIAGKKELCGFRLDNPKDYKYLYGTDPFLCYRKGDRQVVICFQICCISTLNGAWVPLDRSINIGSIERSVMTTSGRELCPEDRLCYLTAKCIYTEKCFKEYEIREIERALNEADEDVMMEKLSLVFFKFAKTLLKMLHEKNYDNIIDALWKFSDY